MLQRGVMRAVRGAALAASASLAVPGSGCGGVASEPASRAPEHRSVLAYVWEGRPLLVRADAVTLERRGRALDLGKSPISTWVRSPDRGRLAIGSGDGARVMFADLRTMRPATLDLGRNGYVAGLAWPRERRVVAAVSGTRVEILVVDPQTRRLVGRHRLRGVVTCASRSPDGLVLLVAPPDRIGPATLAVANPGLLRTVALPLEIGVDPPGVVEPGLAVSPDGRRAVVAGRGNELLEVDLHTLAVTERELSEPVSLLGRLRSWLEPAAPPRGRWTALFEQPRGSGAIASSSQAGPTGRGASER
jgi:hypothetical protein